MTYEAMSSLLASRRGTFVSQEPEFREPAQAFSEAIAAGRLSAEPNAPNFAGKYMYMGTWSGRDGFKHIDTREYLKP
jgi:hypothetical protein